MNKFVRQLLPFISLMLIICIMSVIEPDTFLTFENFINVLSRSTVEGIMALGMTAVIITAGIDLSVGAMGALCGMVGAWAMIAIGGPDPHGFALTIGTMVGILTGTVCGLMNGALITALKLPPFIVTLGTMSAFRGLSLVMHSGKPYDVPGYHYLGSGAVMHIPVCIVIFALLAFLAILTFRYTRWGRYIYAIGSNTEAAFHAGVNVNFNLTAVYTVTGLLAGIAAMIATSRTVSAQPTAGIGRELDVIAAVVIGGASLSGGRGTILGTIIGTLLISFLKNGCLLLGISSNVQLIVIGAVIIAAVTVDQLTRSQSKTSPK